MIGFTVSAGKCVLWHSVTCGVLNLPHPPCLAQLTQYHSRIMVLTQYHSRRMHSRTLFWEGGSSYAISVDSSVSVDLSPLLTLVSTLPLPFCPWLPSSSPPSSRLSPSMLFLVHGWSSQESSIPLESSQPNRLWIFSPITQHDLNVKYNVFPTYS